MVHRINYFNNEQKINTRFYAENRFFDVFMIPTTRILKKYKISIYLICE